MKKHLIMGAALAVLAAASTAYADPTVIDASGDVQNVQTSVGHEYSNVTNNIQDINGKVTQTSAAIGNSFTVSGTGSDGGIDPNSVAGAISNTQETTKGIGANIGTTSTPVIIDTVTGDVSQTAAAIGNSATVTVGKAGTVNNYQGVENQDPAAYVNSNIGSLDHSIFGNVNVTAAALGNSLSVTTPDSTGVIDTINNNVAGKDGSGQVNAAPINATVNTTITSVTGTVSETAAAIGNSFSARADSLGSATSVQTNTGPITANLNTDVSEINWNNVTGNTVSITAAALGNSASFFGNTTATGGIDNTQTNGGDISATVTGDVGHATQSVTAKVSETAAAIGNSFSASNTGSDGGTDLQSLANVMTNSQSNSKSITGEVGTWAAPVNVTETTGDVSATAAAIGNSATDNFGQISNVNNSQTNTGAITSLVNENVNYVTGSLTETSASIGNSLTVTGPNGVGNFSNVTSGGSNPGQVNTGSLTANVNSNVHDVTGSVSETAAAIGNSASVSSEDMGSFSNGQSNSGNLTSTVNSYIYNVNSNLQGDQTVALTAAAIGNSLSFTGTNGGAGALTNSQYNSGWITANVTSQIGQAGGTVNAAVSSTAAAIGNSYSVTVK